MVIKTVYETVRVFQTNNNNINGHHQTTQDLNPCFIIQILGSRWDNGARFWSNFTFGGRGWSGRGGRGRGGRSEGREGGRDGGGREGGRVGEGGREGGRGGEGREGRGGEGGRELGGRGGEGREGGREGREGGREGGEGGRREREEREGGERGRDDCYTYSNRYVQKQSKDTTLFK